MHCFAHRLQLVVVAVSRCCSSIEDFFEYVALIVNAAGSSCKRKDILLDKQRINLLAKLESGEIFSGRGKNQETSLARPGDTRWGSHYKTLVRIESMWDAVIQVLAIVHEDERNPSRAGGLVQIMESFSFVFIMKLINVANPSHYKSVVTSPPTEGSEYCSSHVFGYRCEVFLGQLEEPWLGTTL